MISLHPLSASDHPVVCAMLEQAGLPFQDLSPASMALFIGAHAHEELVGIAGLETYGSDGLLRSLLVVPGHRGQGLAQQLVSTQESNARKLKLQRLVLLTETAAGFFRHCGYQNISRTDLSAGLLASPEFLTLCPASARCLSKPL